VLNAPGLRCGVALVTGEQSSRGDDDPVIPIDPARMNLKRAGSGLLAALLILAAGSAGYRLSQKSARHTVTLQWQAPSTAQGSPPLRYNIYRSDDDGQSYPCIARRTEGTTYLDVSVKSGKTYSYVVTALDEKGRESVRSEPIKVTVPH
jgi:hypothetical protein